MTFAGMMNDRVTLVKRDGKRIENIGAIVQPKKIFVDDATVPIEEGDRFHRLLPNGLTEVYLVLDRGFYSGMDGTEDHYQVSVQKETALPLRQTGPTIYNISGPNARVNINSVDSSANVVSMTPEALFQELRTAITRGVPDLTRQEAIMAAVSSMEKAQGKKSFSAKYRDFIGVAADHMTLLAPFIPALSQLLS